MRSAAEHPENSRLGKLTTRFPFEMDGDSTYLLLVGGTIPFIRKYSTICP